MSFCLHSAPNNSRISWIQNRRRLALKNSRFASVAIRAITGNSTMANSVRVAAVQMTSVNDLAANFATCSRLVKEAVSAGAKFICFPENFSFVATKDGESLTIAEPLDGPIMQGYRSLARSDYYKLKF
ncbi:Nitrilase-like protein 2 [Vitis vinifera]|uniref:Nitrilase-like protein 2 n=1 Tax=Vitis vinifera TaxID=29760 RepID=A0A438CB86_VITVI|nr:Nitrilase-like protein 2 [Vitis vinifera]